MDRIELTAGVHTVIVERIATKWGDWRATTDAVRIHSATLQDCLYDIARYLNETLTYTVTSRDINRRADAAANERSAYYDCR